MTPREIAGSRDESRSDAGAEPSLNSLRACPVRAPLATLPTMKQSGLLPPQPAVAPVRWGILGAAHIAVSKVIPAMQRSPMTPVVAIASRDAAKASLQLQLYLNVLFLAQSFPDQPDKCDLYCPQQYLHNAQAADDEPTPPPPPGP